MANVSEELARLAQLRDQGVLTQAEFDAQKSAILGGGGAAVPPSDKPKPKVGKGCLILIVVLALLGVIGAIAGGGSGGGTSSTEQKAAAQPPVEVTATELFRAYEANEAAAQQKYGDRPLLVSGTVTGVTLDMTNDPVVQLRTPNEFMNAQASLVDADKAKANGLSKGQDVRLLCGSVSEVIGTPMLRDCSIQ